MTERINPEANFTEVETSHGDVVAALTVEPERGAGPIHITVQTITPELAGLWLEQNLNNPRRLRPAIAARYASDMAAGRWAFPVDFIGFSANGDNVNGQHRLQACVDTGTSFTSLVIYGVGESAVEALDRGLKRFLSDTLAGRGYDYAKELQSAIRLSWKWDSGALFDNKLSPSDAQALDYLQENPGLVDAVVNAKSVQRLRMRLSVVAPLTHRAEMIDAEQAKLFLEKLITGIGLEAGDPILKLRDAANRPKVRRGSPQAHELALAIKAWNGFITGRKLNQLKWGRDNNEAFPVMVDATGHPVHFPGTVMRQRRDETTVVRTP